MITSLSISSKQGISMIYTALLYNKMKQGLLALFLFILIGPNPTSSYESEVIGSEEWVKNKVATYSELNWLLGGAIEHAQI